MITSESTRSLSPLLCIALVGEDITGSILFQDIYGTAISRSVGTLPYYITRATLSQWLFWIDQYLGGGCKNAADLSGNEAKQYTTLLLELLTWVVAGMCVVCHTININLRYHDRHGQGSTLASW